MSEVTTQSAVSEALSELNLSAPQLQDPIAKFEAAHSEPVTEGQGSTETPKAEVAPVVEAKPESTTTEPVKATAEPTKTTDAPQNEDETLSLTAEDYDAINKNPAAKKAYQSMLRDYRKKTGSLAERRKQFEQEAELMEKIKTNPRAAIQALAAVAGVPVTLGGQDPVAPTQEDLIAQSLQSAYKQLDDVLTPEGAKVLRPVLENLVRAVAEQTVAPLKVKAEQQERVTAEATINSTIKSFGSARIQDGEEWSPEIETEMANLVGKILPGKGMDIGGYVNLLYDNVIAGRIRAANRKREFERLKAAQAASEPVTGSRPTTQAPQTITAGMNVQDATRLAVAQALSDMRSGR